MTNKEFNLSDNIFDITEYCDKCEKSGEEQKDLLNKKEVKEYIKKEGVLFTALFNREIDWDKFIEERKKLAGKKLI